MVWARKQMKEIFTRELRRKALNEEFCFAEVPGSDCEELIVPAKKYRGSEASEDLTTKLHYHWSVRDDNGDELTSDLPLDTRLSRRQTTRLIKRGKGFEIGQQCACPALTLRSACKHAI